jgi:phosphonopyruvate decarboxylase
MIDPQTFTGALVENGISFFTGVPDSLLNPFCAYLYAHAPAHIAAANEGNAVALAAGHYLATGNAGCVYMQNSGLGNAVNPLVSLMDAEVYRIPALLVIGLRGEEGVPDEPQHRKQGRITEKLLDVMEIEHEFLRPDTNAGDIARIAAVLLKTRKPYALIARKGVFAAYAGADGNADADELSREEAITFVLSRLEESDVVVASTGHIAREIYRYRRDHALSHRQDFLTVGSMGHASSIALGIAEAKPDRRIICFDGDGAFLMHSGTAAVIGSRGRSNFRHIVLNNRAHDSVGGLPTAAGGVDFPGLARSCAYTFARCAVTRQELKTALPDFLNHTGTAFLEIRVRRGARSDLCRPAETPEENKRLFMDFIRGLGGKTAMK